ncbi:Rne/Rng family ribonuclease [Mesoterricola sediminis]|uniref:Ribonuclease G n=1 Tax=Mesoterricola sediminis TaxID=2927980 RepID=A0AA48KF47_9BACT|nr:Rne/Rng family ribonuclease [Mesoterricola sediminis]BDU78695.1 ribonuclease G [Mesoterricola sediminis]
MEVRRSLVVNATPLEMRIALLENGQLCELFIERTTQVSQVGDVYKGRVAKLLQGMQSAFVSIGGAKDGFLYLDEPETHRLPTEEAADEDEAAEGSDLPPAPVPLPPVKEGEEILVQVVKDPIGSKGPRLSRHISFPGRFLVLMPGIEHVGISRKITNPAERERLRNLIKAHAQPGEGFIVRTAAIGEKDEDLIGDVTYLRELWSDLQANCQSLPAPSLVWKDFRLLQKVLRDLFREEVASFWVDRDDTYREVVDFVSRLHPEWVGRIKHFTSDLPIFEAFAIEKEIEAARQPKVFLKHGGSIVINQTEALVSVDVNTGKFVGKKDLEETVFLANMEAIPEIVRQLRLRNLGGIVVIDFIDMMDPAHRESVMKRLQEELERDRNHARAVEISDFGLVEMTRKRTGPSLERLLTSACPHCEGSGRRLSAETVVLAVYREMARQGERLKGAQIRLTLHAELRAALQAETREGVNQLARALGAHVQWQERNDGPVHHIDIEVIPNR